MARQRVFDDAMVNVLLGAAAATVGVTLAAGAWGFVMGLTDADQSKSLGVTGSIGFGLLAGMGMCPVSILFGGSAAHAVRNREMTVQLVVTLAAVGFVATLAFGALIGMIRIDAFREIAVASIFGALGAVISAWLYDLARRHRVWVNWVARLA